jgi:predicted signal transduction protein with EAL and GGDEF domain
MKEVLGLSDGWSLNVVEDLFAVIGPEERERTRLSLESTIAAGGHFYSLEHKIQNGANKARFILQNAEITYDRQETVDRVIATFQDVTKQRMAEEQIHHLAHFDPLTGLPKRQLLVNFLNSEIEQARRYDRHLAIVVVGIDGLKRYRDALGHAVAEQLVRLFADRLKAYCRASDFVSSSSADAESEHIGKGAANRPARLGQDEFVITLSEVSKPEDSRLLIRRIRESLNGEFCIDGQGLVVTSCMGISVFPLDAQTADDLVHAAEVALNVAREQGPDTQQYYTESLNRRVLTKFSLESELRKALEAGELQVHYQPQQSFASGNIVGIEALARWPHLSRGYIPPPEFIAIAEESGLIDALGDWVLWTVCKDIQSLQAHSIAPIRTAINLSPIQFRRVDLVQRMQQILEYSGVSGESIEIELTESVLMSDVDRSITLLGDFRDIGCTVAIDDFGTGYSSLSYLKRVPAQVLKIDRSFVRDIDANHQDQAIVRGIVQLGHSLSMQIVVEGVEKVTQRDFLSAINCDVMQGYLLSRPRPFEELVPWLQSHEPDVQELRYQA